MTKSQKESHIKIAKNLLKINIWISGVLIVISAVVLLSLGISAAVAIHKENTFVPSFPDNIQVGYGAQEKYDKFMSCLPELIPLIIVFAIWLSISIVFAKKISKSKSYISLGLGWGILISSLACGMILSIFAGIMLLINSYTKIKPDDLQLRNPKLTRISKKD